MATSNFRVLPRRQSANIDKKRYQRSKNLTILTFLLPGFVLLFVFMLWPIAQSVYYSLYDWNGLGPLTDFVGVQNYQRVLGHGVYRQALTHSLIIIMLSLLVQLPLAMALALLLARGKVRGKSLFRAAFFIPYVFSEIVTAFIWLYVYHPSGGLVNTLLSQLLPDIAGQAWLANKDTVLPAVFFVMTWKFFGFHMLLYMAALQNVSREVEDAARIDGAQESQVLRFVTLPMIGSTIRLTVFLSILGSMQQFIIVWILTEGGPVYASELIVTYLFKFGIQRWNLGYGSAVAVLLFAMTLFFSIGYQRTVMRQDYEG